MRRLVVVLLSTASLCGPAWAQDAPRGLAETTLRGKRVSVEYGRPALKGRSLDALLAELPDDRVWRAGSNGITTFTTDTDVSIVCLSGVACSRLRAPAGARKIRAGKYSLYVSVPSSGAPTFILNSDPGIELGALGKFLGFPVPPERAKLLWPHLEGYNMNRGKQVAGIATTEVARAVMAQEKADAPVDPFTITLKPVGQDALTLTLAWADRTWSVDMRASP